jgi:hypothetical protein
MCTHCGGGLSGGLCEHDQVKREMGGVRACWNRQCDVRRKTWLVGAATKLVLGFLLFGWHGEGLCVADLMVMWGDVGVEGIVFWGIRVCRACCGESLDSFTCCSFRGIEVMGCV